MILEITERICGLMKEQNVTRGELARRLGTTQSVVTKWLDGTSVMKVREVSDMFCVLNARWDEFPRIWIPRLGDRIMLRMNWTFDLYREQRNKSLIKYFEGITFNTGLAIVTLPRGSILKVERIYIRRNQPQYDSVTFRWEKCRFWAKLADVNTIRATYYGGEID